MGSNKALACVMGDMDLVRPLGLGGIGCAVVARPGLPTRFSRFTRAVVEWVDSWEQPDALVDALVEFGAAQPEPPVLFYEEDRDLLLVSRHRERLRQAFRFVVADAELVEDLVDKARFQALAERLELPVPATRRIRADDGSTAEDVDLQFPIIIKPLTRRTDLWAPIAGHGKAIHVETRQQLRDLWPRLTAAVGLEVLAQEMVPGDETCIESYHAYVDPAGETVAAFTGKKIRTYPREYGHSTALVITDTADVAELGRELVRRLNLTGVSKFDFKRGPDGRLRLLEINPRFNLWHHPAAVAGVNLPALVYADLTGQPRPAVTAARAGVRWCYPWQDALAAKAWDVPLAQWVPWALRCEATSVFAWDDPMPFLRGVVGRKLFGRARPAAARVAPSERPAEMVS